MEPGSRARPRSVVGRCHDREVAHADPLTCRAMADAAWRWVLDQVRWDGPWIPEQANTEPVVIGHRQGQYMGTGGLAHVLTEIRLHRPWTAEEASLADAISEQV